MDNHNNPLINELQKNITTNNIKRDVIDNFGEQEKIESIQMSEMLRGNLVNLEEKDKPVFNALTSLQNTVNDINPHNFKLSLFDKLFGKKNSLKQYFKKFQDNKNLLEEIIQKLEEGKQILMRDNIALEIEANRNAELANKIKTQLALANETNQYLESLLNQQSQTTNQEQLQYQTPITREAETFPLVAQSTTRTEATIQELDSQKKEEIQNNILFPLKQKIMDLQQQILVHTQGELALRTLINNNKELINSVDRTKSVTLNALNVAIITAQGLNQQQRVLQAVQDINAQTSDLIAHTGAKLKEQGSTIQQSAANTMLDMEKLKGAFDNVLEAMEDMKNFKVNSLPKMQENIQIYDQYIDEMMKAKTQNI